MTTIKELKDYCRKYKIKGYSKLKKTELEKLVNKHKNIKIKSKGLQGSVRNPGFKYGNIKAIKKTFPPSDDRFILHILDADGIAYTRNMNRWARYTGPATMSFDNYSIEQLFQKGDIFVRVYQSKIIRSKISQHTRVPDKIFHAERLNTHLLLSTKLISISRKTKTSLRTEKNKVTIKDIKNMLQKKNWKEDAWGNYKNKDGSRRVKFQKTSFRIEKKQPDRWVRMSGGYYKEYKIVENKLKKIAIKKPTGIIKKIKRIITEEELKKYSKYEINEILDTWRNTKYEGIREILKQKYNHGKFIQRMENLDLKENMSGEWLINDKVLIDMFGEGITKTDRTTTLVLTKNYIKGQWESRYKYVQITKTKFNSKWLKFYRKNIINKSLKELKNPQFFIYHNMQMDFPYPVVIKGDIKTIITAPLPLD